MFFTRITGTGNYCAVATNTLTITRSSSFTKTIFSRDPSLAATFELAEGWMAERENPDAPWRNADISNEGE